jgi:hypothetical protein
MASTTIRTSRVYRGRPTVTDDPRSHTLALKSILEALNVHERRTSELGASFVRFEELVEIGLIKVNGNQMELNIVTETAPGGAVADGDYGDVIVSGDGSIWTLASAITSLLHARSHAMTSNSDHTAGNHKIFYTNGSGQVVELSLGAAGTVVTSNGTSVAPSFEVPSGGGGSPGGSDTQVQYNNGGAFGGMAGLVNASGNPRLTDFAVQDAVATPAAPAAGAANLFGYNMGRLALPSFLPPSGLPFAMLNGQIGKRERWLRGYVGTSYDVQGFAGLTGVGVGSSEVKDPTSTTIMGQCFTRRTISTAASNVTSSVYSNTFQNQAAVFVSCSGNATAGGFFAVIRAGWPTLRSDQRIFLGLVSAVANFTGEPSARTDFIGIGADESDTDLQWMYNDGSGTATKTSVGIAKASLDGDLLELRIYVPPGGGRADMLLRNLETGDQYTTFNITSDLPAADQPLLPAVWANTGVTTTTAVRVAFNGYYAVEDYA